jgi:hypothetical protein
MLPIFDMVELCLGLQGLLLELLKLGGNLDNNIADQDRTPICSLYGNFISRCYGLDHFVLRWAMQIFLKQLNSFCPTININLNSSSIGQITAKVL